MNRREWWAGFMGYLRLVTFVLSNWRMLLTLKMGRTYRTRMAMLAFDGEGNVWTEYAPVEISDSWAMIEVDDKPMTLVWEIEEDVVENQNQ